LVGGASAIWPEVWVGLFTSDPATFEVGIQYMRVVGPFYALQGLGLSLYFASQGAGKVNWPIIATIARFIVTAGGATVAVIMLDGSLSDVFLAAAAGMTIYGLGTAVAIKLGAWRR
jgi:Na+-driven multidrug efflux pump